MRVLSLVLGMFLSCIMFLRLRLLFGICLLLLSCESSPKKKYQSERKLRNTPTLLNFNACFSDMENQLSFPIWFNDSILKSLRIKEIIRESYILELDEEQQVLKHRRTYSYDKHGRLLSLCIDEYYEGALINSSEFKYAGEKDEYGYASARRIVKQSEFPDHFKLYQKQYFSNYLSYTGEDHSQMMYVIPNSDLWKPLTVDTMLRPQESDFIIYGTPSKRLRQFRVKNKVEESQITEFLMDAKGEVPISMNIDNYPFITKRSFSFGEQDKCTGFTDSLFSGKKYLNSIKSTVSYQRDVLPIAVHHRHLNFSGQHLYTEIEQFNYTFYE